MPTARRQHEAHSVLSSLAARPAVRALDASRGQSYVLDPQGRLRLLVRHERIAQDLAHDLRALLK